MANGSGNVSNVVSIGGADLVTSTSQTLNIKSTTVIPTGAIGEFISLHAQINSGTDNQFYRLHQLDGASGDGTAYQVPNGFKFHAVKVIATNPGLDIQVNFQFGTATASFTDADATVPTGAKYQSGYTSRYVYSLPSTASGSIITLCSWEIPIVFDQNLFPFMQSDGGGGLSFTVIGKLVAV